jgi:hypothetical protein
MFAAAKRCRSSWHSVRRWVTTPIRAAPEGFARLAPVAHGFELVPGDIGGAAAWSGDEPFGALFGGVAAGAEAFRAGMRWLSARGHDAKLRHAARELQPIRLQMPEPKGRRDLGRLDVISAAAITHGMLFALLRVPWSTLRCACSMTNMPLRPPPRRNVVDANGHTIGQLGAGRQLVVETAGHGLDRQAAARLGREEHGFILAPQRSAPEQVTVEVRPG